MVFIISQSSERIPRKISRYFMNTHNLDFFSFIKFDNYTEKKDYEFSDFAALKEYQKRLSSLYNIITEKFMKNTTNKQEILNDIDKERYGLFVEIDEEKYNRSLDTIGKIFNILKKTLSNFDPERFLVVVRIYDPSRIYFALSKFPHSTFLYLV